MLSPDQLESVHLASVRILEEVGVEMLDDEALAIMARAGAEVDAAAKRVRLPRELVMQAVADAPASFTLHARNPARGVTIGGDTLALLPVGGPTMVSDRERGRRPGTFADQVAFIKLSQHSRLLDTAYHCVEAHDLPPETRHLDYLYAALRYTDKPLVATNITESGTRDGLTIAALLCGGAERLRERPVVTTIVNGDSPLRFGREALRGIVAFARARQPVQITPFVSTGLMAPVTPAGALAQENAECLAGIALAELASPGTPVVYGSFAAQTDMRTAAPVFGSAEGVLLEIAAGQLAQRYGLPHRGMGLVTNAYAPDAQAAADKMSCLWALAFSNTHVLLHAAGWLEGGLTADFEQFVLDLDMLASMERLLAGFPVDEESLALDAIAATGPGGSFLMADHTLAHFRATNGTSPLLDSRPYDVWQEEGAANVLQRANALWKRWLKEYEEPAIDPALHEAIATYVARRKRGEPAPEVW